MGKANPDLEKAIDQRLQEALAQANYRTTLNVQRKNALVKLQKNLVYAINGGTFSITTDLISFVSALLANGKQDVILLDVNDKPIEIMDLKAFFDKILSVYYECMNEYLAEAVSIAKARTTKVLVGEQ